MGGGKIKNKNEGPKKSRHKHGNNHGRVHQNSGKKQDIEVKKPEFLLFYCWIFVNNPLGDELTGYIRLKRTIPTNIEQN